MMNVIIERVRTYEEEDYTVENYSICVDGKNVGCADMMVNEKYGYCDNIQVNSEYRNQGIGTQVLNQLSEIYGGIVIAPDNADAQRLYERLGSEWYGEEAGYIDQGYGVYEI